MYYYGTSANKLSELMKYALLYAKEMVQDGTRFDVFNCLNIMDNPEFLQELKFGIGDGVLNYYMYNYHIVNEKGVFNVSISLCIWLTDENVCFSLNNLVQYLFDLLSNYREINSYVCCEHIFLNICFQGNQ